MASYFPASVMNAMFISQIDIAHFAEVVPAVNQVEIHVFQQQKVAREYLAKYNTQIMSWGSFAEGKNDFFNTPVLKGRKSAWHSYDSEILRSDIQQRS